MMGFPTGGFVEELSTYCAGHGNSITCEVLQTSATLLGRILRKMFWVCLDLAGFE